MALLDATKTIPQKLSELGIPASVLASLCNIPSGVMSTYLNGGVVMPGPRRILINDTLADIELLIKKCSPLSLNFSDVGSLRECIQNMKSGRLQILVELREPTVRQKAFSVRLKNSDYFVRYRDGKINQALNFVSATAMTEAVADELIVKLDEAGYRGSIKQQNTFKADNPAFELEQIWS